jgi:hypothetical protein
MAGRYPKTDAERRNHIAPAFSWVYLAPKPRVRTPPLPKRELGWHVETQRWWRSLWAAPQAAMWDPTGRTLWGWARLHDLAAREGTSAGLEAEMRQHEDRHGLNPKAMLQLRWRVVDPGDLDNVAAGPVPVKAAPEATARRRRLMRSLDDGVAS